MEETRTWHDWRPPYVVAALLIIALAAAAAVALARAPQESPGDRGESSRCLPWRQPTTVAQLNRQTATYRRAPGFLGADVGASVQLQDGRSLWVFGDTLRAADFKGDRFVRNSMLVFSAHCGRVIIPADHGAIVPDRADGVGYWPMSLGVVHRPGIDLVGVSVQRVRTTGRSAFDFENLGPAMALFSVRRGEDPHLVGVTDIGPDSPTRTRPTWGAAVATHGSWVYVYGTANPDKDLVFGWSLQVARTRIAQVMDRSSWRFWDGRRWQRDPGRARVLIPATGGVSQTLSVFERDGSWYAVSKRDEFLGHDLVIWKAPAPTGPFMPSKPLAQIPSDPKGGVIRYMPLAHPGVLPEPGKVLVSYSRNVADLKKLAKHPTLYRPRFLQVPLP